MRTKKKIGAMLVIPMMLVSLYGCNNLATEIENYVADKDITTISLDDYGTNFVTDIQLKTENASEILTEFLTITETVETFTTYEDLLAYKEQITENLELFNLISEDIVNLEIPEEVIPSESVGSFLENSLNTVDTYTAMFEELNNLEVTVETLPEEFSKEVESIISSYNLEAIQEPYMEDLQAITEEFNLDSITEMFE